MSKNAWRVAEIVRERIHDASVLGDFITALLAEKRSDYNFFNHDQIKKYFASSKYQRRFVPGRNYIEKIIKFVELHYNIRELYKEFLFRGCYDKSGNICDYCTVREWISPVPATRIPQPMPDPERPFHFRAVANTQVKSMGLVEHQMTFSLALTLEKIGMQVGCRPMMTLINFQINMQFNLN